MAYESLFQPLRIKKTVFRNRILGAPSSMRYKTPEGGATENEIAYVSEKARGGAAQITIGETPVDIRYLTQKPSCVLQLENPANWPSISELALAIRNYGAVPSIQLCHGGAETDPALSGGQNPIGPSSYIRARDGVQVEEMTQEQIHETAEAFGRTAELAQMCGFEMVMLHGGHGWLLSQFINPRINRRTDEYGGSLENRARFPLEVIESVRRHCGADFLIEYRISGDELCEDGLHLEDTLAFLPFIDGKVDLIHISGAHHARMETWEALSVHPLLQEGTNVPYAAQAKMLVHTPITVVGAINTPAQANEIIATGKADFVSMARALIADPEFPKKAYTGREDEIIPCVRCNNCLGSMAYNGCIVCSVNPRVGRNFRILNSKPTVTKRVAIVGGGPAGMQAAITAAGRGHQVTLFEKSEQLGGVLKSFEDVPLKVGWMRYVHYMDDMVRRCADVKCGVQATAEAIRAGKFDAALICIGAEPLQPCIEGASHMRALSILDQRIRQIPSGSQVVILGGGLSGVEEAYVLADAGCQVTLVELRDRIGFQKEDASFVYALPLLLRVEKHPNIQVYTRSKCKRLDKEYAYLEQEDGAVVRVCADWVIFALGMRARWEEALSFKESAKEVIFLGDCVAPKRVADSTGRAYFAALEL